MTDLKICRICLRTEAKVYNYEQFQLKSYYEEVLALKVNETDDLPHYFCFECATFLHKFHKFKEKCFSGLKVLKEMLSKGPAGIIELLKLSTNTSSQETEMVENPFLETDINIMDPTVSNNEFSSTGPIEIDSFFINNLDVVLGDDQIIENAPLSNICSDPLNKLRPFPEPILDTDSDISKTNNRVLNVEKIKENDPLPIIICEIPSDNQTLLESDLGYIEEINKNPTENLEGIDTESSSILYCGLPNISPVFSESNLEGKDNNLDVATNNNLDLTVDKETEIETAPIVYFELPNVSQDFQEPIIEYIETDLDLSKNNVDPPTEKETLPIISCEQPSTSHAFSVTCIECTDLNESVKNDDNLDHNVTSTEKQSTGNYLDISQENRESNLNPEENGTHVPRNKNESFPIFKCTLSGTSDLFGTNLIESEAYPMNQNDIDVKVKVVSKNQLTPNIHCVIPTTSQEYFETSVKPEEEDDTQDSFNQLQVEEACVEVGQNKAKRRERRKYPFSKRVKPNPCHKKCGNKCSVIISEVDRLVIHERYWKMDKKGQQEWLLSCIKPKRIRRRQGATCVKNITYDYFINHRDKNIKVCQQFLMKTLDVSQMRFRYAVSKLAFKEDNINGSDSDVSLCSQES